MQSAETQASPRTATIALPPRPIRKAAVSLSIPRLADFSHTRKLGRVSPAVLAGCHRAFEGLTVLVLGFAIAALYVDEPDILTSTAYWIACGATATAAVLALQLLDLYRMPALSGPLVHMPRVIGALAAAFIALFAGMFFLKVSDSFSRVWLAVWFVAATSVIVPGRLATSAAIAAMARSGRLYRRTAIYGTGPVATALIADLEADPATDVRICGVFDDRDLARTAVDGPGAAALASVEPRAGLVHGYPRLGGLDDLVEFARSTRLDLAIVALPLTAEQRLAEISRTLSVLPADVKLPANATSLRFARGAYSRVGAVAMIDLYDTPISGWGMVSKWLFDKTIAGIAIVLLAPILLAIALAVKLDSRGPVLFRQKRYGFNNELIEVLKFRSMYVSDSDVTAARLVTRGDPRVTRVGRFIRKTSLDELPQLFNVLLGNLSLVGPRPHATEAKAAGRLYDEVVDGYFARHKVKPGITGWAQINGWRGETDTDEKIRQRVSHDLWYIENWSVFLDFYILALTPWALLTQRDNAY